MGKRIPDDDLLRALAAGIASGEPRGQLADRLGIDRRTAHRYVSDQGATGERLRALIAEARSQAGPAGALDEIERNLTRSYAELSHHLQDKPEVLPQLQAVGAELRRLATLRGGLSQPMSRREQSRSEKGDPAFERITDAFAVWFLEETEKSLGRGEPLVDDGSQEPDAAWADRVRPTPGGVRIFLRGLEKAGELKAAAGYEPPPRAAAPLPSFPKTRPDMEDSL